MADWGVFQKSPTRHQGWNPTASNVFLRPPNRFLIGRSNTLKNWFYVTFCSLFSNWGYTCWWRGSKPLKNSISAIVGHLWVEYSWDTSQRRFEQFDGFTISFPFLKRISKPKPHIFWFFGGLWLYRTEILTPPLCIESQMDCIPPNGWWWESYADKSFEKLAHESCL